LKKKKDKEANRKQNTKDHHAYCSSPYGTVKTQGLHTWIPHAVLVHLSWMGHTRTEIIQRWHGWSEVVYCDFRYNMQGTPSIEQPTIFIWKKTWHGGNV